MLPTLRFAAALLALAPFAPAAPLQGGPAPVFIDTAEVLEVQEFERVLGSLRAKRTSQMAALEEGALIELAVREGDVVAAGAALARVDDRRLRASRAELEAQLATAAATFAERSAQLENARVDLEAVERAAKSGAVSDRDLRNARTAVKTGEALAKAAEKAITALEAQRDLLDLRLADTLVRAPFDATVTMRHAEIGQWIRPGDGLVTLVSTGPLEAWLDMPERLVGQVDTNTEAMHVLLEATGATLQGKRPRVVPMVDPRARTFQLVLDVQTAPALDSGIAPEGAEAAPTPQPTAAAHPGMSISAQIPIGTPTEHLVVSPDAIVRRGPDALIVTVTAGEQGDISSFAPVRVLFTTPQGLAIEPLVPDSIAAGTRIIVEGNERIFPGTPVTATHIDERDAEPEQGPEQPGQ